MVSTIHDESEMLAWRGIMKADIILINGKIYTDLYADESDNFAEAIAITNDKISYIGANEVALTYNGEGTQVFDLSSNIVLPAFMDAHLHMPGTWIEKLFSVYLFEEKTVNGYVKLIKDFYLQNPDAKIITGQGWENSVFAREDGTNIGPTKEMLDQITTEIPIVLTSIDVHSVWCNQRALDLAGITRDTPDTDDGLIERYDNGEPSGTLREEAQNAAKILLEKNPPTKEQYKRAVIEFQKQMHSFGISGVQNMFFGSISDEAAYEALQELADNDELRLRVNGVINISPSVDIEKAIEYAKRIRSKYNGEWFKVNTIKCFLDGVVEGKTAYLKQPYEEAAGKGDSYYGTKLWEDDELFGVVSAFDNAGFQMHMHATGDAAVDQAIRAVQYAKDHGNSRGLASEKRDNRHVITHFHIVDKADIERLAPLNIVAVIQPYWHFKEQLYFLPLESAFLGEERAAQEYPCKSLFDSGIVVASSSDCPVTPINNPMMGIYTGTTRMSNYDGESGDVRYQLDPSECAAVAQIVDSFTHGAAYAMSRDGECGRIEVGKKADLIVLDTNIFTCDAKDILNTKVQLTIVNGEVQYKL